MKKQPHNKFINIIEYMSVPATIIDISKNEIIASNSAMLRSYGLKFSKTLNISFESSFSDKENAFYFIINNTKSSVTFIEGKHDNADFEFLFLDNQVGILFEILSNNDLKLDNLSQTTADVMRSSETLNVNFSYMYNFAFNIWQYSDYKMLKDLNIINKDEDIQNFNWRNIIYKNDLLEYDNGLIDLQQEKTGRCLNYRIKTLDEKFIRVFESDEKWPVIVGSIVFSKIAKKIPIKVKNKNDLKIKKQNKTVLFIEDMALILNGISTWLESWGYNVLTADNGEKGWQLFQKHYKDIDVVIQDYILPDKGGDSLLVDMLSISKNMPVIVISGNSDENNVTHLKKLGAHCFLEKPFKIEELKQIIEALFTL